jgi:hypothetical protein
MKTVHVLKMRTVYNQAFYPFIDGLEERALQAATDQCVMELRRGMKYEADQIEVTDKRAASLDALIMVPFFSLRDFRQKKAAIHSVAAEFLGDLHEAFWDKTCPMALEMREKRAAFNTAMAGDYDRFLNRTLPAVWKEAARTFGDDFPEAEEHIIDLNSRTLALAEEAFRQMAAAPEQAELICEQTSARFRDLMNEVIPDPTKSVLAAVQGGSDLAPSA